MSGLIVDNFAGGGGASTGIEAALGRPVDLAIWRRVDKRSDAECWPWTGSFKGTRGALGGTIARYSYALHFGAYPPDGKFVCHKAFTSSGNVTTRSRNGSRANDRR